MRIWFLVLAILVAMAAFLWAGDKITPDGERTVYTVACHEGSWQGAHCSGRLEAAGRFRFRALKPHREVVFWTVGSSDPSGKFMSCEIKDGRNWICLPNADSKRTITLQMEKGEPVADDTGQVMPFHAIAKWRWYLLGAGVPVGSDADA
jgi:hypothetical protein